MMKRLKMDERIHLISSHTLEGNEKNKLIIVLNSDKKLSYNELETMLLPFMVREPINIKSRIAHLSSLSLLASSGLLLFSNELLERSWRYRIIQVAVS
mmetsp:Transcript_25023/g.22191  ORF Transcript_25023/g.22191 Transcript_25023/m.22191 type:complete len:98 (-) Transcript_25023:185-478(-)